METKTVSIIIPVKPGGTVKALDALQDVDYPSQALEILVAEGKCPSRQRNTAAVMAKGEILYFLDDDSMTSPGFLTRTVGYYDEKSVAAVGGPSLTPAADPPLRQAFALVLSSRFGSGHVCNRYRKAGGVRETGDNELILCNLSMRSDVFFSTGGFNERLYPNEENELMVKIMNNGLKLVHDPDLAVYRGQRRTLPAFIRQIFGYGRGRCRQTLISGVSGIANFVPAVFLLYLLCLPLADNPVYYLPLLCYLMFDFYFAARESFSAGKAMLAPLLCFLFPVLHLSYGAGIVWEFLASRFGKKDMKCRDTVTLRRVKEFGKDPVLQD